MSKQLEWVKKIYPEFSHEEWMNSNVLRENQVPLFQFYEFHSRYEGFINPKNIIGIDYSYDYNDSKDITWLELLKGLRRIGEVMKNLQTYEDVVNHIHLNPTRKNVSKYGDDLITTCGQHRLCLAKFLNLDAVKVHVKEHRLNEQWYERYTIIRKHWAFLKKYSYFNSDKDILEGSKNEFLNLDFFKFSTNSHSIKIKITLIEEFIRYYQKLKFDSFRYYVSLIFWIFNARAYDREYMVINSTQDIKKFKSIFIRDKRESRK